MIPISKPIIGKHAKKYLLECLKTGWVSSKGPFIGRFEEAFAAFVGAKYAVAVNSGTAALHLALVACGIGEGDEVIIPAFTMIATALPVLYVGATPVLVDVEEESGNIDIAKIEAKISKKTRAIVPVHMQGHPADMDRLTKLAKKYKLMVIEDAAEAHGAAYKTNGKWKMVGSIGDMGCFSFYANKVITTGEGGMVVTNSWDLAKKVRSLRNLARAPQSHFIHKEIAFAYRMSNLSAALGLAQLEEVHRFLQKKKHITSLYKRLFQDVPFIQLPIEKAYARSIFWHYTIRVKANSLKTRDQLVSLLEKQAIETRNFFIPMHRQPALKKRGLFRGERYPVAEQLSEDGLCLPSGPGLSDKEIGFVVSKIKQALR